MRERTGLTYQEVEERVKAGLMNGDFSVKTKSIGQIMTSHIFTLFNIVNFFFAASLLFVQSYKNMLFLGVVLWNILIGVIQEIRSKKIIDRLSLLSEPKVQVLRNGKFEKIRVEQLVLDDLFSLRRGNQVCTDAVIMEGECEVNESLLTGESEPVFKKEGDEILSGSFLLSGNVLAQAVHVGKDNYVNKILAQAKYIKKSNSEILNAIKKIIKTISIVLLPVTLLLFWKQMNLSDNHISKSVVSTVAAVIGMIPSGLVLLTSVVLAVSVIRLAKRHTLVQELYCIESLARVDTLCLDKTGTLTEGILDMQGMEILSDECSKEQIDEILYFFTNGLNDDNPTFFAIKNYSEKIYLEKYRVEHHEKYQVRTAIPFSSEKKWSLVDFEHQGSYVIGALEVLFPSGNWKSLKNHAEKFTKQGVRVLVLAYSKEHSENKQLPEGLTPYAFLMFTDRIRESAPETLRYFKEQGVQIKILSGDNPQTVAEIAKRCGVENCEDYIDATTLKEQKDLEAAAEKYRIFGRVTPIQKYQIVQALKRNGRTVAMTGDGANDVMALKEADCSIAMQSGCAAARNVSQIVLMDSDFSVMPQIVAEGRRTIHNIQRSAALYLAKTVYSILLAVFFLFVPLEYPFYPIQLTLIGSLTIGIPSFLLAIEPNFERVQGNFLKNVLRYAFVGGGIAAVNVILAEILGVIWNLPQPEISTMAFFGLAVASLAELIRVSFPWNIRRSLMCMLIAAAFLVAVTGFPAFFELGILGEKAKIFLIVLFFATPILHLGFGKMK